jgi:hypothetical protein
MALDLNIGAKELTASIEHIGEGWKEGGEKGRELTNPEIDDAIEEK